MRLKNVEIVRIPLFIEFNNRKVLVLGGGEVGTHRAKKFLNAGARVVVLSREFTDELKELSKEGRLTLYQVDLTINNISFLEAWIAWADLVVYTIPNRDIAEIVRQLCRRYNKLLNDATDVRYADVVVPLEGQIDSIRIAVTTEGRSSTFAKILRDWIIEQIRHSENIKKLAEAWFKAKNIIKSEVKDPKIRMKIYRTLMNSEEFQKIAITKNIDDVERYVREVIRQILSKDLNIWK